MFENRKAKLLLTTGKDNLCDRCMFFIDATEERFLINHLCCRKMRFRESKQIIFKKTKCKYFSRKIRINEED
jgi:hypothetical protein